MYGYKEYLSNVDDELTKLGVKSSLLFDPAGQWFTQCFQG
jgi:hypothetical protein